MYRGSISDDDASMTVSISSTFGPKVGMAVIEPVPLSRYLLCPAICSWITG